MVDIEKLDDMGISNDNTTFINIDGCINPIGQKSDSQYMNYMFSTLSQTQAQEQENLILDIIF